MNKPRDVRRLTAAGAILLSFAVSACGSVSAAVPADDGETCPSAPEGSEVTLTMSSWTPGVEDNVAYFNENVGPRMDPKIQVELNNVPGGNAGTYQQYSNQIIAGSTGDIGMVEYAILPSYRLQQSLANIVNCPGVQEAKDDFSDAGLSASTMGEADAMYGIPQDVGPLAMYYRADLFDEAGIPVPTTWEEYSEAATEVRATGAHIGGFQFNSPAWFEGLAWQAGAQWFDSTDEGWVVTMTDEPTLKVADYWTGLVERDEVVQENTFSPGDWSDLDSGKLWTMIAPPWMSTLLATNAPSSAGDWAVAPIPQWTEGESATGMWGGSDYVVWSTSEYPAQAAQFLLWLETSEEALTVNVTAAGQFPAYEPALDTVPVLTEPLSIEGPDGEQVEYYGDDVIWETFGDLEASAQWQFGPTQAQTDADLAAAFGAFSSGTGTIADALRSVQESTEDAIEAQGLTVVKQGSN
ncbi:MAG: extracellular solute-binding protein [Ornithinimicrobium sp.]